MPLPDATYALQGQSRPGDTMYSKPKHGMLLRLSVDAANALQSDPNGKPTVEFVVAEDGSSSIVIGESSFSLQSQTEDIPHDLYLRAASASKPFVPLKYYANVVGKLTISSEREWDEKLADRIHKKTAAAAEQRSISKTKFLDANQLPQPTTKASKKKTDPFRKPLRASDHPKPNSLSAPTSSTPTNTLPSRPSNPPKQSQDGAMSVHKRLIHYLALSERTTEETYKAVGGPNADANAKQELLEAINKVAEPVPSNNARWRLKSEAWLEVRPYEWPRLSETDRTNLARGMRMALKMLGVPESDPRWEHARYRAPANAPRSTSPAPSLAMSTSTSTQPSVTAAPPKRGITSQEAREKKAKKTDPKAEIMIKDETKPALIPSPVPLPSGSHKNGKPGKSPPVAIPPNGVPSRQSPALRRPPGSGYKLPSKPHAPIASSSTSAPVAASKDVDVPMKDDTPRPLPGEGKGKVKAEAGTSASRAAAEYARVKKEEGELSTSSSGPGGIGGRGEDRPAPVQRVQRLREEAIDSDKESDKGKDKPKDNRERTREKDRTKERGRERDGQGRERERERDRPRALEREKERDERDSRRERDIARRQSDMGSLKRKKPKEEDDSYEGDMRAGGKRRLTEDGRVLLTSSMPARRDKPRDPDRGREHEKDRGRDKPRERDADRARDRGRDKDRDRGRERDNPSRSDRDARPSKQGMESASDRSSHSLVTKNKIIKKELSPMALPPAKAKKESSPLPPPKMKKEPSPPPPPRVAASSSSSSSTKGSTSKGTKLRRKSPIYTSSEDEDGAPRHPSPPLPTPPTISSSSSSTSSRHSHSFSASMSGTSFGGDLRNKYSGDYAKYLRTYQPLFAQKVEVERLLASIPPGAESIMISDSDGEGPLIGYEDLTKLMSQHKQQWEGLQTIQKTHSMMVRGN